MYVDANQQLNAKLQAQKAYENAKCEVPMGNLCSQAGLQAGLHAGYTLVEDAQRSEQFHCEQAQKAGNAARFLASHPEFDEFIRLVRAGALHF